MVSRLGGHLGPPLGVVELTLALHYIFDTPKDKLLWDVGHQAYAHKILTGRRDQFHTLKQYEGIIGYPNITRVSMIYLLLVIVVRLFLSFWHGCWS